MCRCNLSAKIDQYVDVLHESYKNPDLDNEMQEHLSCLLSSLVIQSIHHRDVMDSKVLAVIICLSPY